MAEDNEYMVCRKLFLRIISAEDLPDVRKLFETKAYAEVSIRSADDKEINRRTGVDKENGLNPAWNHDMTYEISESGLQYNGHTVVIKLYCKRKLLGDRYIGQVHTNMKDLFDKASRQGENTGVSESWPIVNGAAKSSGVLNFSYSFGPEFRVRKSDFKRRARERGNGAWIMTQIAIQAVGNLVVETIVYAVQ